MSRFTVSAAIAFALAAALCAGGAHAADKPKPAKAVAKKAAPVKELAPAAEFAHVVYKTVPGQVHNTNPQALLRAVVVLRVRLDEQDQWKAEVFRDNPDQPEMTQAALDCVSKLPAPTGLSAKTIQQLKTEGVVEAWLFQTDGKFALKSIAKPQRRA